MRMSTKGWVLVKIDTKENQANMMTKTIAYQQVTFCVDLVGLAHYLMWSTFGSIISVLVVSMYYFSLLWDGLYWRVFWLDWLKSRLRTLESLWLEYPIKSALQEKLLLATQKVVAKNLILLLKMNFAMNFVVAGTVVAKAFSNDYGGCKRYLFLASCKRPIVAIPSNIFSNKKSRSIFSAFLATTFVVVNYLFFTTIQVVEIHDSQYFPTTSL